MRAEMIKFAVVFLFGVVWGGRLENTYLPPGSAKTAGGNGNLLETPFSPVSNGNGGLPVSNYGAPSTFGSNGKRIGSNVSNGNGGLPASNYGAPSTFGSNGKRIGSNGNGGFGFNGAKSEAPEESLSNSIAGNVNGPSPVYGGPLQNSGGHYSGRLAAPVNILRYSNENDGTGIYKFEYETENHISQQERGDLKNVGTNSESSVVQGTYSYAGPDGHTYTVNYIADENGFQPTGEHIHLAVQAAAADSARASAAEDKAGGGYYSGGQYQSTANGGYQY